MANILTPGFLKWDGTKFVTDNEVEGEMGPPGPPGAGSSPGGSNGAIQYRVNSTTLGGAGNVTIADGYDLAFGTNYSSEGTIRLSSGGTDGDGFSITMRNGEDDNDLFAIYGYSFPDLFQPGVSRNILGIGHDWNDGYSQAFDDLALHSRRIVSLAVNQEVIFTTRKYHQSDNVSALVGNHANFGILAYGQDDILDAGKESTTDIFGDGYGVVYLGNAHTAPSSDPVLGLNLWTNPTTGNLSIRTSDGGRASIGNFISLGSTLPVEGNVRIDGGGVNGEGLEVRVRGIDSTDGTTSRDIGVLTAYTWYNDVTERTINQIDIGDWAADPAKSPDMVNIYFNRTFALNHTIPSSGDALQSFGIDTWDTEGPIEGQPRRIILVQKNHNFAIYGTRDHLPNVEDALGNGEGVFYFGHSEVRPSDNPVDGITLFVDSRDDYLKYRRPNGNVTTLREVPYLDIVAFPNTPSTDSVTFVNGATFEFDLSKIPNAGTGLRQITLRVIGETTDPLMTIQLYNLTEAGVVADSSLTISDSTATLVETNDLTDNLTNGPAVYQIQINMAPGTPTDRVTLVYAALRVEWFSEEPG